DPSPTATHPRSLHDALPIYADRHYPLCVFGRQTDVTSYDAITRGRIRHHASALRGIHGVLSRQRDGHPDFEDSNVDAVLHAELKDRKSTRLNSSHVKISYAV